MERKDVSPVKIDWEKLLFSSKCMISAKEKTIGSLSVGQITGKARGGLMGQKIEFKKTKLFEREINLIDPESGKRIGMITYTLHWRNLYRPIASIRCVGKNYTMQFKSLFSNKFTFFNGDQVSLKGKANKLKGQFEVYDLNPGLILSALLVSFHLRNKSLFWGAGSVALITLLEILIFRIL